MSGTAGEAVSLGRITACCRFPDSRTGTLPPLIFPLPKPVQILCTYLGCPAWAPARLLRSKQKTFSCPGSCRCGSRCTAAPCPRSRRAGCLNGWPCGTTFARSAPAPWARIVWQLLQSVASVRWLLPLDRVLAVVAAEAAGRVEVADVVGVLAPVRLHLRKEIAVVDRLDRGDRRRRVAGRRGIARPVRWTCAGMRVSRGRVLLGQQVRPPSCLTPGSVASIRPEVHGLVHRRRPGVGTCGPAGCGSPCSPSGGSSPDRRLALEIGACGTPSPRRRGRHPHPGDRLALGVGRSSTRPCSRPACASGCRRPVRAPGSPPPTLTSSRTV